MIRSMTGFGSAAREQDGARCSVEIRSVNNRFFKASMRLPSDFEALEPDIESADEAKKFCDKLQLILRYLGISDADMEKGQMRTLEWVFVAITHDYTSRNGQCKLRIITTGHILTTINSILLYH